MAENKTKLTGASVEDYIAARANEQQHSDCQELMALLEKITREPPKMWGQSDWPISTSRCSSSLSPTRSQT